MILQAGKVGEVYNNGGHNEMQYAIDPAKIYAEPGRLPETMFADRIRWTIRWYLEKRDWWEPIISGE